MRLLLPIAMISLGFMCEARTAPALASADSPLAIVLKMWEQNDNLVRDWHCQFTSVLHDRAYDDNETVTTGDAFGSGRALRRWDLRTQDGSAPLSRLRIGRLHVWCDHQKKQVQWFELGTDANGYFIGRILGSLCGSLELQTHPCPEELQRRCTLRLCKEDAYWIYIEGLPRKSADRAEFARIQLVLARHNLTVARIHFELPNGNTVTTTIERLEVDLSPPVTRESLTREFLGSGWKGITSEVFEPRTISRHFNVAITDSTHRAKRYEKPAFTQRINL
jgi:hypothetical protein